MKLFAIILFTLTYALMIAFQDKRQYIALISAFIFICSGLVKIRELPEAIDFNVLLMLCGTMGTVSFFIASGMPNRIAEAILAHTPNVMWVAVAMSLFAGAVSAFIDNVATVLMIAPVGLAIAKKLRISPVPLIICIAVSSNLQGAATLVGDTTSIMLSGFAGMDFTDFFFINGKPGIFFAVELGALATVPVIMLLFKNERQPVKIQDRTEVTDYFPTVMLILNILLLILASLFKDKPAATNGIICLLIFAVCALRSVFHDNSPDGTLRALREIDYNTLLLLAGLFVVISAVTNVGIIDDISALIARAGKSSLFLLYTAIVFGSTLCSAFVDNIPFVATMLPVVEGISRSVSCSPYLLYFGLLIGATLGGNLTPIGASANIAGIGILRREGYTVKTRDFLRIGVPFTLCAVIAGYIFVWVLYR
jgi:Na+/H+ antiporter NhaD/arsenite permease-like protein